jgi:hypothetical protein
VIRILEQSQKDQDQQVIRLELYASVNKMSLWLLEIRYD